MTFPKHWHDEGLLSSSGVLKPPPFLPLSALKVSCCFATIPHDEVPNGLRRRAKDFTQTSDHVYVVYFKALQAAAGLTHEAAV